MAATATTPDKGLLDVLSDSRRLGFLGPGPIEDHIEHALGLGTYVDRAPRRAADVGAGGGVPGLVLAACLWPSTSWSLLDASQRRTDFLRRAVASLGLGDRVVVVRGRMEELAHQAQHRGQYDLVVARSFGPPAATAECSAPLLEVGGHLVVSEPPDPEPSDRWNSTMLEELGLMGDAPDALLTGAPSAVRFVLHRPPSARYPRRTGIPTKRPLG